MADIDERLGEMAAELAAMRALLERLVAERTVKDAYTTAEVAAIVGRSEYQVRTWCQQGRIAAAKADSGHGPAKAWKIPYASLEHYRSHGLRPAAEPVRAARR